MAKLHGIWGRLALTLAHVRADGEPVDKVGERAALYAERLVFESLLPNMVLFYQSLGSGGDVDMTRAIAAFLLRENRARVTASDMIQHIHSLHGLKADQVRDVVSPLVTMGWLTPDGDDERRARAWHFDLSIQSQFAERAHEARMQLKMSREILNAVFRKPNQPKERPADTDTDTDTADAVAEVDTDALARSTKPPKSADKDTNQLIGRHRQSRRRVTT